MALENDIAKNISEFEKKQKKARMRAYIITAAILFVTVTGYLYYRQAFTDNKVLSEKQAKTDTLLNNPALLADTLNKLNKNVNDSARDFAESFLSFVKKDSSLCRRFFADIVLNYYGYPNVPVASIIQSKKRDLLKYPAEVTKFNKENFKILLDKSDITVFANNVVNFKDSTNRKDSLVYNYEIVLNDKFKIVSITSAVQQKDFRFRKQE
ncbi:MAG: hypothetical protein WDN26_02505 [Chitinophagaceae bacterium]